MITRDQADEIVSKFMERQNAGRDFTYECYPCKEDARNAERWAAVVQYYDVSGGPIDGPAIVFVDKKSGAAVFARGP
jgi:hypothetical protein